MSGFNVDAKEELRLNCLHVSREVPTLCPVEGALKAAAGPRGVNWDWAGIPQRHTLTHLRDCCLFAKAAATQTLNIL